MNILARWRIHRKISKAKSELAALYRQYDKVCRVPGHTSVFTANEIGNIGSKIALATYHLKQLKRELNDEADPQSSS